MLKEFYNIPNARPIIVDGRDLFLLDGGDKRYYVWCGISSDVGRIKERDLRKILAVLDDEYFTYERLPCDILEPRS